MRVPSHTCSTVVPVMNASAYSPCLGCRMRTHSLKEAVLSLPGFTAALTCRPKHVNISCAMSAEAHLIP